MQQNFPIYPKINFTTWVNQQVLLSLLMNGYKSTSRNWPELVTEITWNFIPDTKWYTILLLESVLSHLQLKASSTKFWYTAIDNHVIWNVQSFEPTAAQGETSHLPLYGDDTDNINLTSSSETSDLPNSEDVTDKINLTSLPARKKSKLKESKQKLLADIKVLTAMILKYLLPRRQIPWTSLEEISKLENRRSKPYHTKHLYVHKSTIGKQYGTEELKNKLEMVQRRAARFTLITVICRVLEACLRNYSGNLLHTEEKLQDW